MALIPGDSIKLPKKGIPGRAIVKKMKQLLLSRYKQQVTRKDFLRRWGRLRKALRASVEYQELLISLARRSDGICERCMVRPADDCHHIERVAFNPDRALDIDNTMHLCKPCHQIEDSKFHGS